jgi:asparagine synthase (glutamine-hydrolysing)
MCGIIGLFNARDAARELIFGMKTMQNRGRDYYAVATERGVHGARQLEKLKTDSKPVSGAVGHCLHAVVSRVEQPFRGKGILVANCEIYNWRELAAKNGLEPKNDAELLFQLLEKKPFPKFSDVLTELDGDFAFAYWRENKLLLARDAIGIKPAWFSFENKRFGFASEAKALYAMGFEQASELNPRKSLVFDPKKEKIRFVPKNFFPLQKKGKTREKFEIVALEKLLLAAVQKRIPEQTFGILFSGGLDSVLLAKACQKLGKKPCLFVAGIWEENEPVPTDVYEARSAANELGLPLVEARLNKQEATGLLPYVVSLIESSDPVKVGIALPLFAACRKARKNECKVLLTGLGADGLFGGFHRQQTSNNLNRDCLSYLLKAYETDLYRDDVVAMQNAVELRVPYYDWGFVQYALQIPASEKIARKTNKKSLRELALRWGLSEHRAFLPKKAMQYGSNADKLIEKHAKKQGKTKGLFLAQFLHPQKQRLGALISGGKDGWYAALIQQQKNYSIECLVSMESKNKESFMFHTPNIRLVKEQSKASGIPLVTGKTTGKKEDELRDLQKTIARAQKTHRLDGIVNGALLSNYQRERIEKICDRLGLKVFTPLWQKNQLQELHELLQNSFEIVFSSIAGQGFNQEWLGKKITIKSIQQLTELEKKLGINPAGEGGEYETLVLDCPLFKKKIVVEKAVVRMKNEFTGQWVVLRSQLEKKPTP